jgi:hypothetical protein
VSQPGISHGQTIVVADARRGDGKCFDVHAGEKSTAFMELEEAIRAGTRAAPSLC